MSEANEKTETRVVAGLQNGRLVNYVMLNGKLRPLLVTDAGDQSGKVNGVLFFDAENDRNNFPLGLASDPSGHRPTHAVHVAAVEFDELDEKPGTWHWPQKQAVMASSVEPGALEAVFATAFETFREELLAVVNAKIAVTLGAVKEFVVAHETAPAETEQPLEVKGPLPVEPAPEVIPGVTAESAPEVAQSVQEGS